MLYYIPGIISCVAGIYLCSWLNLNTELYPLSFNLLFIIPLGSVIIGFISSSGFYLGSLISKYPPHKTFIRNIFFMASLCFFVIYYIEYILITYDGIYLSEVMSFLAYLKMIITESSYTFVRAGANTGEIGKWGYLLFFTQYLGFIGAFIGIASSIDEKPKCNTCNLFLKNVFSNQIIFSSDESFLEKHQELSKLILESRFIELIDYIKEFKDINDDKGDTKLSLDVSFRKCTTCDDLYLNISSSKFANDDWKEVKELELNAFIDKSVAVNLKY